MLVVRIDRGSTHTHSDQELSVTVNGRDEETDSHQAGIHKQLCRTGAESTGSIRMHCLFGAQPSTSSPVEPMGSDILTSTHSHSLINPLLVLGLNRPAFLTTFTQWSECTKPSGETQSVCETERHKCRFGCASCKQNKERPFTSFLASSKCLACFG